MSQPNPGSPPSASDALADADHPVKSAATAWAHTALADPTYPTREAACGFWRDGLRRVADRGILGLLVPEADGGAGAPLAEALLTLEGLGKGCLDNGLAFAAAAQIWSIQNALTRFASAEQRERYLTPLVRGDAIGAFCMSEPGSGSDAFALATVAHPTAAGYELHGAKTWITLGPVADVVLVFASTRPDAGQWGISAFLIDAGTAGLTLGPNRPKMGWRTVPFGDVTLDGCVVPTEQRLGPEGAGASIFAKVLDDERAFLFAAELGTSERLLETCVAYARERHQFGQPIGAFQAVSHRITQMRLRHETARALMYRAALMAERGQSITEISALVKMHATESSVANALDAVHIHGARGYVQDYGIERELHDTIGGLLTSGTTEVQSNIVARMMGLG